MIQRNCCYDRIADIMEVVPDCSPNITAAIETGAIEDRDIPALFNQLTSTSEIGHVAGDVFDMVAYQNAVKFLHGEARKKAEEV